MYFNRTYDIKINLIIIILCFSFLGFAQKQGQKCSAATFLKLKESLCRESFLTQLAAIRQKQYPSNDQEVSIMVDLTPEYLEKFLHDIDIYLFTTNNYFEKEYHFNIAPEGYTDPKVCKDKITISFNSENCSFTLKIFNTFLVEPNWCTESMVIYSFKIEGDRIIDFWRNEAG